MFKGNRDRHRSIMAELRALEAQEAGITAAQVVSPPKDKLSLGKALVFLGGLSAVTWFLVFSDESPFGSESDAPKGDKKRPKEGAESYEILNQIRYGEMDDVRDTVKKSTSEIRATSAPTPNGFLDAALSRTSLLGGSK